MPVALLPAIISAVVAGGTMVDQNVQNKAALKNNQNQQAAAVANSQNATKNAQSQLSTWNASNPQPVATNAAPPPVANYAGGAPAAAKPAAPQNPNVASILNAAKAGGSLPSMGTASPTPAGVGGGNSASTAALIQKILSAAA